MRVVLVADTHGLHDRLPPIPSGDVLVHAGDLTPRGTLPQTVAALEWLAALPHRHKIVIAGNHDWSFQLDPALTEALVPAGVTYLRDSETVIEGVRFWGSPWQPEFFQWAFNLPRGEALARVWAQIPDDVEVLVTHTPPHGVRDRIVRGRRNHVGCEDLRRRVDELRSLRLHVFGHVHEEYGVSTMDGRHFVNASSTTVRYEPVNEPIVVDL